MTKNPGLAGILCFALVAACLVPLTFGQQPGGAQSVNLAEQLSAGQLHGVNRTASALPAPAGSVHLSEAAGSGLVWLKGTEFSEGTIEVEVRGRDVYQQSFPGIAFHGVDDQTYEAVYLRPFNFRADDPVRHKHAVQYVSVPDNDWPKLREKFPDEFESSVDVDKTIEPAGWVSLRIVVAAKSVRVYVGKATVPALSVRRLGSAEHGMIGLWAGNNSDGDFANLRITRTK